MAHATRGKGAAWVWLSSHINHDGDECLIWPFHRKEDGYGILGYNGGVYRAHRLMCRLVNGHPPSRQHEAAHECGNGHLGCVNPKHIKWKTSSQNQLDRRRHGTASRSWSGRRKLTAEQAAEIKASLGKITDAKIAERFGITRGYIYQIRSGLVWKNVQSQAPEKKEGDQS